MGNLLARINDSALGRTMGGISLIGWLGNLLWVGLVAAAAYLQVGVWQAMLAAAIALVFGVWALHELQERVPWLRRTIVEIKQFHPHMSLASLYVTNKTGRHDEFTAQIVGWSKGEVRPREAHLAWTLRWEAEAESLALNHNAKGRIDFVWLEHRDPPHTVDPAADPVISEWKGGFLVYVNGCDPSPVGDRPPNVFQFSWHRGTDSLEPTIWTFLVRFTSRYSGRSQEQCVTAYVIGGAHDDPTGDDAVGVRFYKSPELRLRLTDPPPKKDDDV